MPSSTLTSLPLKTDSSLLNILFKSSILKHLKSIRFTSKLLPFTTFLIILALTPTHAKNGFDLTNSLIPQNEILHGGPKKDGIPAIDKPKFVSALKASFLNDDDRVLALNYKGVQRAYPIKILNWHEIVNDTIKGDSITVTFCPLCGTGLVYFAKIDGTEYHFGVSGLLYNSDVLLYDRETDSLWSQLLSKAISGKMTGTKLKTLPIRHTSWKSWREKHPNTEVLSLDTGFDRDYAKSPYQGYGENKDIYFPLSAESRRFHPKERVLGLEMDGKFKAYSFKELAKNSSPLKDTFSGKTVTIEFSIDDRDGEIQDEKGNILPTVNSFWFAWYAFHPDGEVFSSKEESGSKSNLLK